MMALSESWNNEELFLAYLLTGRVLIRFSKDLYFLDNVISRQFFDLLDVSYLLYNCAVYASKYNYYIRICIVHYYYAIVTSCMRIYNAIQILCYSFLH